MVPVVIGAAIGGAKALGSVYSAEQERKNQKKALKQKKKALEKLAQVTPSERSYVSKRNKIIREGDPTVNKEGEQAIQTVKQTGAEQRLAATGQSISQGLEQSVVAQELRRRVDKDTLRQVAKEAQLIAKKNAAAKKAAELEIEKMNLSTDARKQRVRAQQADIDAQITGLGDYDPLAAVGSVALGAISGGTNVYMDALEWSDDK